MESTIAGVLDNKGRDVVTIARSATVFEAVSTMVARNVGAICVTENGRMCGIFTERDYLRRVAVEGRTSKDTRVEEVMTSDVVCVGPAGSVNECLGIMSAKRCRHLPVMDDGELVGIVSIGDCVKRIAEDAEFSVEYLSSYIAGR